MFNKDLVIIKIEDTTDRTYIKKSINNKLRMFAAVAKNNNYVVTFFYSDGDVVDMETATFDEAVNLVNAESEAADERGFF